MCMLVLSPFLSLISQRWETVWIFLLVIVTVPFL
jgi:hypothetical protein